MRADYGFVLGLGELGVLGLGELGKSDAEHVHLDTNGNKRDDGMHVR